MMLRLLLPGFRLEVGFSISTSIICVQAANSQSRLFFSNNICD